jgi:hypothetical protein
MSDRDLLRVPLRPLWLSLFACDHHSEDLSACMFWNKQQETLQPRKHTNVCASELRERHASIPQSAAPRAAWNERHTNCI